MAHKLEATLTGEKAMQYDNARPWCVTLEASKGTTEYLVLWDALHYMATHDYAEVSYCFNQKKRTITREQMTTLTEMAAKLCGWS